MWFESLWVPLRPFQSQNYPHNNKQDRICFFPAHSLQSGVYKGNMACDVTILTTNRAERMLLCSHD